jgi:HEAT repeat protein
VPAEQAATRLALCHIATNNLSTILAWLREPEPSLTEPSYVKTLNRLLSKQPFLNVQVSAKWRPSRPSMAFDLLTQIQPAAKAAIPNLILMLGDSDREVAAKAGMILGHAGRDAIPALTPALSSTNEIVRTLAVAALREMGSDASGLIPKLQTMLEDRAVTVRISAAEALGKMGDDPEALVRVLLECFHEGDNETSAYALDVLGNLKERAKPAIPDLLKTLSAATNDDGRILVLIALRQIDPAVAAKAEAAHRPADP